MFVRTRVFVFFSALALIVVAGITVPHFIFAQSSGSTSSSDSSSSSSTSGSDDATAQKRAQLQAELNDIDTQIAQTQSTLTTLGTQHKSLQNSIDTLTAQITKDQLQLKATQVEIQALQSNIVIHSNTITTLSGQLTDEQQTLAQIIRNTNDIDNYSLVDVVLSSDSISDFFNDLDSYDAIKGELGTSYTQITDTRSQTETEKSQLEDQQTQAQQLATEEKLEEQQVQQDESQKQQLLTQTKSQEASVQSVLTVQQQTAAQIRAELFALAGGSGQISLPAAITLAKQAGADTGVDPALILGILKQETNIGQNVGTANYEDAMHPKRDIPVFLVIMKNLGLDPNSMKVSAAPSYGYGGAMGPAQFIPSTWACYGGYENTNTGSCSEGSGYEYGSGPWQYVASKDRIAKLAGHPSTPSDPWNNTDAFVAVGMLMSDNGAVAGDTSSEREAALRYFAGWGNADNPAYAFYGDDVMAFTAQFESDINTLAGS